MASDKLIGKASRDERRLDIETRPHRRNLSATRERLLGLVG
jgi:hypothetical protein